MNSDIDRLEKERLKKERLEKERLEKERLEKERLKKDLEKMDKEIAEIQFMDEQYDKSIDLEKKKIKDEVKEKEARKRAIEILENEDPIDYILKGHQKVHTGDYGLAKLLLLSIGVQSTKSVNGIQPSVSGESGKGKTHCCRAMMHLIPEEYVIDGTFSDKVLYYKDLKAGTVIFNDDAKLSPDFDATIRRATTQFQGETIYETMSGGKTKKISIPPRIVWWLTSVNEKYSEELLNRMLKIRVDESLDQDKKVYEFQQEKAAAGRRDLPDTKRVKISREIIRKIKSEKLFEVIIPYANDIEIGDIRNRRYGGMVDDVITGFAVFRYKQRKTNKKGQLIAKIQDFDDAAEFFNKYELIQSPDSFNDKEICIGNVLNNLNTALTRQEVADKCGMSLNTAIKYLDSLELKLKETDIFRKFLVSTNPGKGGRPKYKYKTVNFDQIELSDNKISMHPVRKKEWKYEELD